MTCKCPYLHEMLRMLRVATGWVMARGSRVLRVKLFENWVMGRPKISYGSKGQREKCFAGQTGQNTFQKF